MIHLIHFCNLHDCPACAVLQFLVLHFAPAGLALCGIIASMRYLYIEHDENRWSLLSQDGEVLCSSSNREDILRTYRCVRSPER
jgi:hypothetical protein